MDLFLSKEILDQKEEIVYGIQLKSRGTCLPMGNLVALGDMDPAASFAEERENYN